MSNTETFDQELEAIKYNAMNPVIENGVKKELTDSMALNISKRSLQLKQEGENIKPYNPSNKQRQMEKAWRSKEQNEK